MAPARKSAAAPAGAHRPPGPRQQPSLAMRELQAGRDVLQVPYSDAAAGTAVKHLKAAAGRPHLRSADTFLGAHALDMGTALGLLNQYLQWFLSGAPASQPDSMPASQYRQWFLSGAPATTSQYSSSTGTSTTCSRALLDGLTECLTLIYSICTALALADTRGVAAGLRSHLVAADTGTFSLVGRAAALAITQFQRGVAPSALCVAITGIWSTASGLVHSSLAPMLNTPSSSSSSSNNSFSIWRDAPGMAQALPAVADMLHWWLQLPAHMRSANGRSASSRTGHAQGDDSLLSMMVQQVQLLVEGAMGHSSSGSGGRPATIPFADELVPPAARAQVRRFLWHALATATLSLEYHNKDIPSRSDSSSSNNSIITLLDWVDSINTSRSRSSISSRWCRTTLEQASIKVFLPPGAGYKIKVDLDTSSRASRQATAALLQLATAGLPQQQQSQVATAVAWLRQHQPRPAAVDASRLFSPRTHSFLRAPGCLCWPFAEAADAGEPHHSSSSSPHSQGASPDSRTSNNSSSSSGGGRSSAGTTTSPRPPPLSSTMAGVHGPDPFNNPGACLQLLAAAAGARWKDCQRRRQSRWDMDRHLTPTSLDGGLGPSTDAHGVHALLHLLLLLVQHMQDAPLQHRNWFLNCRAGSAVLQMLGELRSGDSSFSDTGDWLEPGVSTAAAAQRQQAPTKGDWQLRSVWCDEVARKLLLPGLLLQPALADTGRIEGLEGSRGRTNSSNSSHPAGSTAVMLDLNRGKPVPLLAVPPSALQLPPGCNLPPAAFFEVEQLLRSSPYATEMHLAMSLLRGSVPLVAARKQQQQQQKLATQDKQKMSNRQVESRETAMAELQRLAFCSLASSVVQAMTVKPALGAEYAGQVLGLAAGLVMGAEKEAAIDSGGSSGSSSSGSSSSTGSRWSVAASLAAALANGSYNAHLGQVKIDAAGHANPSATTTSSSSSSNSGGAAGGAGCPGCSAAAGAAGDGLQGCIMCLLAGWVFISLRCMELGTAVSAGSWACSLGVAAQWCGSTLQQHLQERLLALAWRHPVPGVCGNVLCQHIEPWINRLGASGVGAVRGRRGTLCGGCKAAWCCCEGCQKAAWETHCIC